MGLGYGLSESVTAVAMITGDELLAHPTSVGRPVATHEIEIRDPDGKPLPEGVEGEIYIRSPYLMREYWRKPEATREALVPGGWLRTGDIGHFEDGAPLHQLARARHDPARRREHLPGGDRAPDRGAPRRRRGRRARRRPRGARPGGEGGGGAAAGRDARSRRARGVGRRDARGLQGARALGAARRAAAAQRRGQGAQERARGRGAESVRRGRRGRIAPYRAAGVSAYLSDGIRPTRARALPWRRRTRGAARRSASARSRRRARASSVSQSRSSTA